MHPLLRYTFPSGLTAAAVMFASVGGADARPPSVFEPVETTASIPAGGEAVIEGHAFCLNLGEPFPKAVKAEATRADEMVVKVLKAAALDGAGERDVLQTQIAIWNAIEGFWPYKDKDVDMTVARALAASAAEATTEPLLGEGIALDEALRSGAVEVTVTKWEQVDAPKALPSDAPYYGAVTLTVRNPGSDAIDVYAPLGLMLRAANEAEQDMGLYAVSQQDKVSPTTLPKTGGRDALPLAATLAGLALVVTGWAVSQHSRRRESMRRVKQSRVAVMLAVLALPFALTACDAVKTGVEAGKMAAATLEHLALETDRLLPVAPADEASARTAVADALQEMAAQAGGDPNLVQAVAIAVRAKVQGWDVEGKQAIVDQLADLESRLAAGEVEDVPAAVDEVVTKLRSGTSP